MALFPGFHLSAAIMILIGEARCLCIEPQLVEKTVEGEISTRFFLRDFRWELKEQLLFA
jgi:hypothetical protein